MDAIKYYSQAIESNPYHFKSYFNRAFALDKLGKFDLAIEDYSKAIEIESDNPFAYYNKGIALNKI